MLLEVLQIDIKCLININLGSIMPNVTGLEVPELSATLATQKFKSQLICQKI